MGSLFFFQLSLPLSLHRPLRLPRIFARMCMIIGHCQSFMSCIFRFWAVGWLDQYISRYIYMHIYICYSVTMIEMAQGLQYASNVDWVGRDSFFWAKRFGGIVPWLRAMGGIKSNAASFNALLEPLTSGQWNATNDHYIMLIGVYRSNHRCHLSNPVSRWSTRNLWNKLSSILV